MNLPTPDEPTEAFRIPPHSIEAEQAVLGGLLLDNSTFESMIDLVSADDFFLADHRTIFHAISTLADRGMAFDVVTLHDQLSSETQLEQPGHLNYLRELLANTPSIANIESYASLIRERAKLRQIISTCDDITHNALSPNGRTAPDLIEDAERRMLMLVNSSRKRGGPKAVTQLLTRAKKKIDARSKSAKAITGLSSGFSDLDRKIDGFQPADLIIVAGRPSMGKTTFAMNLVENAVLQGEKPVLVYSLEMPGESLIMRMLASLGRVDLTKFRSGRLEDNDWPRLSSAIDLLNDRKLFIDDTSSISPSEMRSRTRRIVREHGELALIMVDYLQLMQIPGASGLNRTNEISEISRSLKALAKEFNCPVVALSQLNRSLEQRPDKRPVNSDLRESGAIEQDADVIMFVYRDEIYHPDTKFKGTAEIIIGKHREGPTGFCRLNFLDRFTRFESLLPGTHAFTDLELGITEVIDEHPRLGRMVASELATQSKLVRVMTPLFGIKRGSSRPKK
ncbi:replicative DNA helicase (plasmid) [Pseudomonas frederiksbergensis]|uniref:Replicative DNA helicase n=1 Tax=Pseudomonas frederiksbergensis TaxID=104087 RepID=A0A1J0EV19_9PSED|nr:replicative DNA helicase [Pseudomonas frederiksbergensis]APC19648.1 replicative DNA helicase [Pseudomonas frederiksbergensis]